ncbi:hypothetical protein J6590_056273 [Homalodisca vitripennis]|nr:hypothetical protein J6590_056273 [Homalodisca vitripennis]
MVPRFEPISRGARRQGTELASIDMPQREAESSEESLVGSQTKSLEPCWPCLAGEAKSSTTTTIKAKVTNSEKTSISQKKRIPLTLEKLDLQKAQSSNGQSLETPVVSVEMSPLENTQSSAVNKIKVCTPNDKSKELQTKQESVNSDKDQHPLPPENLDVMHVGEEVIFSGDEMDCVVMEEVVETTEYLGSPSPCTVPSVVVTEVVNDTVTDDIVEFSEDLLMPPDVMEETSSDHGYESYDSPISEPDHLVNLFPELEFW